METLRKRKCTRQPKRSPSNVGHYIKSNTVVGNVTASLCGTVPHCPTLLPSQGPLEKEKDPESNVAVQNNTNNIL